MPKYEKFFHHPGQYALWNTKARFAVTAAGRRSGKTKLAIRKLCMEAARYTTTDHGRFIYGAPTRDQAKRIAWRQIKDGFPPNLIRSISETELTVTLWNGADVQVVGFDKPMRAEGDAIDGAVLDEFADMKEEAWTQTLRLSLGTRGREGWCWFIGKPRGRNHFYDIYRRAQRDASGRWAAFHWSSEEILTEQEIAALIDDLQLDPLSYDQEVRANFVNFAGRVYYCYLEDVHGSFRLSYQPRKPLDFAFDFNVEPGSAVASQPQVMMDRHVWPDTRVANEDVRPYIEGDFTACLGEVHIPRNSSTRSVCRKLVADWAPIHKGIVRVYGDPAGGQRSTKADDGLTDWDIVREELRKVPHWEVQMRVAHSDPGQIARVNAVNYRLMDADGRIRTLVDVQKCPQLAEDFDGVAWKDGADREIEKKANPRRTHWSDGFAYQCHEQDSGIVTVSSLG